jgi:hypothetical protein
MSKQIAALFDADDPPDILAELARDATPPASLAGPLTRCLAYACDA